MQCHYGKEDISFGKFYKAATKTCRRLLCDIFLLLFFRTHVREIEKWPSTVEAYCFEILGWSRKKYRDYFSTDERTCLSADVKDFAGDVSVLFKILIKICDKDSLPESFFSALRAIKNVRNRVCHDQLDFREDMLYSNMEDLKQLIETLLEEVSSAFSIDICDMKQKYLHDVDEITAAPISGEGLSYFEQMEIFREDLMGKLITYGRKELFSHYSKLKILNPFTWLRDERYSELQVDKIFTPVYMMYGNIVINVESLLVAELYDDIKMESTGMQPTVLILSGIAGSGKTSLCRYLLYDWRTGLGSVANLRSIDILILIEARNITMNSLVTYLQRSLLRDTCHHFDNKDILPILHQLNVLYVIDGMDEASLDGIKLIDELFSFLGNARVILTTRPECSPMALSSVRNHNLSFMFLQIYGFSKAGIIEFTSKVFKSLENNEEKRQKQELECLRFLTTTGKTLGSHMKIPLTVALLILLWRDDKKKVMNIKSVTKLYQEIFKMCNMKMISRLQKRTSTSSFDLEMFIEDWLLELGRMAYDMVSKNEYIITNENRRLLTLLCKKHSVDSIQALSAFLICEVQESINDIQYNFSFIHKSQMEYLAGHYLSNLMLTNFQKESQNQNKTKVLNKLKIASKQNLSEIQSNFEVIKMRNVFMFTVGHLCLQNEIQEELVVEVVEMLLQKGIYDRNVSLLWHLVQESECHPTVCKMVSKASSLKYIWKPQQDELCDPRNPMVQLLKHTDYTPLGVTIRIVSNMIGIKVASINEDPEWQPYVNVLPILSTLASRPNSQVILKFDQQFYSWGFVETADNHLQALLPNGNLMSFLGHLGVPGAKVLKELKGLREINVRISDVE
ncbi:hypothetical protein SK128_022478, partial [Halocaridina rubra]